MARMLSNHFPNARISSLDTKYLSRDEEEVAKYVKDGVQNKVKFFIIGDGEDRQSLELQCAEMGPVPGRVAQLHPQGG